MRSAALGLVVFGSLASLAVACTGGPDIQGEGLPTTTSSGVVGTSSGSTSSGSTSSGNASSTSSAGGPDPAPLTNTAYSTTCTADTDCIAVQNPPCSNVRCSCANRAISRTEQTRYQSDLNTYETKCEQLHPGLACGIDCAASQVKCCTGTCTLVTGTAVCP
jgi:hypothetical protein